jgi:putative GTP pyrophosphokinase
MKRQILLKKGMLPVNDILKKDGLTIELLTELSYQSQLGIRLKKNLHYFDREELFEELERVNVWYDTCDFLHDMTIDYRIKSIQSARLKYDRYYPDHQTGKVFNDMLGFRTLCDDYEEVMELGECEYIRLANMSDGKAHDDGYRGVHVYFQLDNYHYPIEIQYNTYYDRQLNNWLHKYLYKKNFGDEVGKLLRHYYENARIRTESDFKEVLDNVLSGRKEF